MDQLIASFFFDFLIDMIGYSVARLALPCLSFGWVYAQPLSSLENNFNIFGYRHDGKGRIEINTTVAGFLGFVIAVAMFFSFGLLISKLF